MDAIALKSSPASSSVQSSGKASTILLTLFSSRRCGCQRSTYGLHSSSAYQRNKNGILQTLPAARNGIVVPMEERRSSSRYGSRRSSGQRNHVGNSSTWDNEYNSVCGALTSDRLGSQAAASGAFAADRRNMQSCKVTAQDHKHRHPNGSIAVNLEQGNVSARDAPEGNLVEVSPSREETSAAIRSEAIYGYQGALTSTLVLDREPLTGGAFDFKTLPLTKKPIVKTKKIVLIRHGLSAWNAEKRIQGSSDLSTLSDVGIAQAERCKQALSNLKFSSCYSSPISRARTSAEVIWSGREEPLIYLDTLKEAYLFFLEGMTQVDAKEQYPEYYRTWREDPVNFHVDGEYTLVKLWKQAKDAWQEMLSAEGELILVVTHKSILRALLCTALGMEPERFRAMDINNGGISVFTVNTRGEPMLQSLNMTSHLHVDGVYY